MRDLRNIREADLQLGPGLNVFHGRNAQGKTSVLESVGLLARVRSFRTEQTESLIRRGAPGLWTRGTAVGPSGETALEVRLAPGTRSLRVDGRDVGPGSYHGRFAVVVYSTERLRVVNGHMRERRQFIDRGAAALWPAYRQTLRDFERVLLQRNAALDAGRGDLETWNERFVELGARLRSRREQYILRLRAEISRGFRAASEVYDITTTPPPQGEDEPAHRRRLARELEEKSRDEARARRSLAGPHRDAVALLVDGQDAADAVSSGQARSLLLALTLATLEVHRQERADAAVALLDDLDSELDEGRATALCREVAERGQALVTTAHSDWAERLSGLGRLFRVCEGRVTAA